MNRQNNSSNVIVIAFVFIIVICFIFDFLKIRNYKLDSVGNNEQFYSGIFLDGYHCEQYSVIQVKFKWVDFDCSFNPDASVLKITDKTKESKDYVCDGEREEIYKDKMYKYYFECEKSEYIIVEYDNGYKESIKTALENKRIVIADLDSYNIDYKKELIKK